MNCASTATLRQWLAHPLPADVKLAIDRLARTDDAQHIAVMPDVHLAQEVCIGTVLATTRLIYPNAVGGDIGCGIAAAAFDVPAEVLSDADRAAKLMHGLSKIVPSNRHSSRDSIRLSQELNAQPLSDQKLESIAKHDGVIQLGTLGRGNHFLEFQKDDEGRLWVMVHSGSRTIGQAIRDFHLARATRSKTGLFYLDAQSPDGKAYLADVRWARQYASENRFAILRDAATLAAELLGASMDEASRFSCDHNHVRHETIGGMELWVHRKGAMSARAGEAGILPGSMGTESYHVEGRGCVEALYSSAHGAGRAMSRGEARRSLSSRTVERELRDVWFDHRLTAALREESPSAYKDVRAVLRAQRDLTRIIRRLQPVLCYKAGG